MKAIIFIVALLLSTQIFAADILSGRYTIDFIRVSDSTGLTYVKPNENIVVKNTDCSSTDLFAISNDSSSYNQMYSALLSAGAASKSIKIWVSTDADVCLNSRQKITILEVDF